MPCGSKSNCVFCDVSVERGFGVVVESNDLIVFRDRAPAAAIHLLVVPRTHIESVKSLKQEDIPLVQSMHKLGDHTLTMLNASVQNRRFGFHIPPFIGVAHLHLHCFGLPFRSWSKWKYPISRRKDGSKGFSWFAETGQVLRTLERSRRVQVWPERF